MNALLSLYSSMPILTEVDLLLSILPEGWKAIEARVNGKKESCTIILSPDGKKFDSLEEVNEYLLLENVKGDKALEPKVPMSRCPGLSETARLKRKHMAMKSPFRNLLKRTLERNHAVTVCKKKKSYDYQMYLLKRKRDLKKLSKGC